MGLKILIIFLFLNFYYAYYIDQENLHNITQLNTLTFGSCYNGVSIHSSRYEIFDVISKHSPDLFMWIGDAAYLRYYSEEKIKFRYKILNFLLDKWKDLNRTHVEKKFNMTKYNPRICFLLRLQIF
jgi:hypothetical protein